MTSQVSDFIPGSLEDTDKYIEVMDGIYVTENQKVQVQMKMCDDNGNPFSMTLHNIIFVPDICNRLLSIITLMNLRYTCLFHKDFCTVYFENNQENALTLPHRAKRKHAFSKKQGKCPSQRKLHLERKLLWNYYNIDWDTDLPDHLWLEIL